MPAITMLAVGDTGAPAGHVFISYRHEDSAKADWLQGILEGAGIRVWRDKAALWPGDDWRAVIRRAVTDGALVFLACFSAASIGRAQSWQNEELNLAAEQMRLRPPGEPWLIPVRFDDCEIPAYDLGAGRTLRSIQRGDLFGPDTGAQAARLVTAVQRILGRADGSTPRRDTGPARPGRRRLALAFGGALIIIVAAILAARAIGSPSPGSRHPATHFHDPGSTGVYGVAFSPDGKALAAGDLNGGTYLWNVATGQRTAILRDPKCQGVYGVAFSRGGSMLAAATVNSAYTGGGTCLWDLATRKLTATLHDPNGAGATSVAFSPDSSTLATDGNSGAYLWDAATSKLTATLNDPGSQKGYAVAFSPADGTLAVADGNGNVYLWDVATGKLASTLHGPAGQAATSVAFSHNGTTITAGGANGTIYLWDVATGQLITTFRCPDSQRVNGVAFSRDRTTIAATISGSHAKSSICLWDVASHQLIATLHDPGSKGAFPLTFSPDDSTLAVGGEAKANTYLWNMRWLGS